MSEQDDKVRGRTRREWLAMGVDPADLEIAEFIEEMQNPKGAYDKVTRSGMLLGLRSDLPEISSFIEDDKPRRRKLPPIEGPIIRPYYWDRHQDQLWDRIREQIHQQIHQQTCQQTYQLQGMKQHNPFDFSDLNALLKRAQAQAGDARKQAKQVRRKARRGLSVVQLAYAAADLSAWPEQGDAPVVVALADRTPPRTEKQRPAPRLPSKDDFWRWDVLGG